MKGNRHFPIMVTLSIMLVGAIIFSSPGCSKTTADIESYLSSPASTTQTAPAPIKIGVLLPLTGPDAALGEKLDGSMELALDLEKGAIAGRPVKLVVEDEGDQDESIALEKAKKLVQSDKVDLMIGPFHDDSSLSVASYGNSVPIINVKWSPIGYSMTAIRNKYTFWTAELNQSSTYPLGLYAYDDGIRAVATLSTTDTTAIEFMQGFIDGFRANSGKVVLQQKAPLTETDYSAYLANIKASLANVKSASAFVYAVPGDQAKLAIFKAFVDAGLLSKVPMFISEVDGLSPSIMKEIGDNIIGTSVIEKYTPKLTNTENQEFVKAYRQKYQNDPDSQAVEAYNAMRIIIGALKITKGNSYPDILGPILRATEIDLPTGHFRFSQNRTGIQPLRIYEVVKTDKVQLEMQKEYPPEEYYWPPYP